ncbi:MAG: hypothetical protein OEV00_05980 [Acidobacteriota bacterium]|nr:hypothetical protein [Acidobacteriota bacterium]MDH3784863.1 hypothetical protein [Acidobacteriota bacterium]
MKKSMIMLFMLVCLVAFGCGSGDDAGSIGDAADAVKDAATDAVDDAADMAEGAVDEATEEMADSPVKKCLELAAAQSWEDALAACKEAAEEMPDDMSVKAALAQAEKAVSSH